MPFRIRSLGEDLPELIVDIGVGRHGRADVNADRRSVYELDLTYAIGLDRLHVIRQITSSYPGLKRRDKAFQHHRGLAGTGDPGYDRQPSFRDLYGQRSDSVDG